MTEGQKLPGCRIVLAIAVHKSRTFSRFHIGMTLALGVGATAIELMSDVNPISTGPGHTAVRQAIGQASRETGVRFDFMLEQAQRESGLRPDAAARTSSAVGLYQFIDQTWLRLVRDHGHRHGLGQEQQAIGFDGQRYTLDDPAERQRILGLRTDARLNALMGGEYARENHALLSNHLNRPVTQTDLSLAHFLGGQGAMKLLTAIDRQPSAKAADLFPAAAAANKPVFFDQAGQSRTVGELRDYFDSGPGLGERLGPPPPGRGHFLSAMPAGAPRVPFFSAPAMPAGASLWQDLTRPPGS